MKKLLSAALIICLAMALVACGRKSTSATDNQSTADSTSNTDSMTDSALEDYTKPDNCATVLLVTINPQFRLYLDENGQVLAVEPVNDDAAAIAENITIEDKSFEEVIENIVSCANNNGYVKENATIDFMIVESSSSSEVKTDILNKAEQQANDTAKELNITINVNTSEQSTTPEPTPDSSTSEEPETTEEPTTEEPTTEEPTTEEPTTAHTHSFSGATCTEPGKCECGANNGKPLGHNYVNGVCTRCNAKDPDYKLTSVFEKKGVWSTMYLVDSNELYCAGISLCSDSGEYSVSVGIGVPLSSLPEDMQNSLLENPTDLTEFEGVKYYIGMGSGEPIASATEDSATITLTDSNGNTLVLNRTDENTLVVPSVSGTFSVFAGLPVNTVFTFSAK